jgi:ADP-dependent phosphofructokinase/glucokinase
MKHLNFYRYFLVAVVLTVSLFSACDISNDEILSDQQIIEKIKGDWKAQEIIDGQTHTFYVTIVPATENSFIIMSNFNNLNISIKSEITEHSITISKQTSDGYIVQGYGLINTSFSKITLDYTVDDGSGTAVNYEDTLTRY